MLENFQGDSWGSIPPLRMPSLLPHDLCHGRSSSLAPGSDRIPVELFQILKDDAVESAALNMQYALCTQYAICRLPATAIWDSLMLCLVMVSSFLMILDVPWYKRCYRWWFEATIDKYLVHFPLGPMINNAGEHNFAYSPKSEIYESQGIRISNCIYVFQRAGVSWHAPPNPAPWFHNVLYLCCPIW